MQADCQNGWQTFTSWWNWKSVLTNIVDVMYQIFIENTTEIQIGLGLLGNYIFIEEIIRNIQDEYNWYMWACHI